MSYILPISFILWTLDLVWIMSVNPAAERAGITTAYTQDLALIACFLPLYYNHKWLTHTVLFFIGIILYYKGATSYIALFIILLTFLFYKKKWLSIFLGIMSFIVFYLLRHSSFMNAGKRPEIWQKYLYFWDHSEAYFWGLGFGSWDSFSRFIPIAQRSYNEAFFLFHNDWIQLLVEGGFLGFILGIIVYIYCVYKAKNRPYLQASMLALGATMCFYSPLRFAVGQVLAFYLIIETIKGDQHEKRGIGKNERNQFADNIMVFNGRNSRRNT